MTSTFGLPAPTILATTFFMSHGARNWPFLTLTGLPVRGGREQKVGLAAEKGRDLQNVHGLGDGGALLGLMHVGDDRQAEYAL